MRILVTGGAGYVGRTLVRLIADEHDVSIIDRLDFGIGRLSPQDLQRAQLNRVDIRDAAAVNRVVGDFKPDVIIHLAAVHFIPQCEKDPQGTVETNVAGTVNLLTACPEACRFVLASSGAVYAPSEQLHMEACSQVDPRDVYGFTKLHGEHFLRHYSQQQGFPAAAVRLFNVVGPGETNPHLLPEIVAQMKAGVASVKLGNLWPKRDYIHVRDAAMGFLAVALNGSVGSGEAVTVNLGTSQQYSVQEIIDRLRLVSGSSFAVEEDPSRIRKVDRPFLGADISLIQQKFGWKPALTIDDAVRDLWLDPDLSDALAARYGLVEGTVRAS